VRISLGLALMAVEDMEWYMLEAKKDVYNLVVLTAVFPV
jgi:hypothetical protein